AIYHSSPTVVGPPNEFLRDESYNFFVAAQQYRPNILYTATNDGQLHAFKIDKSPDPNDTFTVDKANINNELWSFFPPAVLPGIIKQYSSSPQILLDGTPVVKDVVFTRSQTDAESGGAASNWHTVLVAGFGTGGAGYYALDITNPIKKTGVDNT